MKPSALGPASHVSGQLSGMQPRPVPSLAPRTRPSASVRSSTSQPVSYGSHRVSRRFPYEIARSAVAGGGSGPIDGGKGRGGGGGGGGGGGSGDGSNEQPKKSGLLQGWAERVAYDPEFPVKVMLEQIIGVGASVVGDMSSRPNWGLNELDFVFSTLVVGSILNFTIMYLLAPTAGSAAAGAAGGNFLARALSDQTLRSWGAPGGNMFEPGPFSVGGRLLNFAYKGTVFAVIGFVAGIAGTSISNGLIVLRKNLDPNFKVVNEQPNIFANAGCWALHMGLSSNLRYQMLGGVDPTVSKVLPLAAFRVYQAGIRALNNVAGGISFVTLARVLGVQKAASDSSPPPPPASASGHSSKGKAVTVAAR